MPGRDEVQSLIKLLGACSIPTSELTFKAKVTRRGARNTRKLRSFIQGPYPTRSHGRTARSSVSRNPNARVSDQPTEPAGEPKLLEEAPTPDLDEVTRAAMITASARLTTGIGYVGASTIEYLVGADGCCTCVRCVSRPSKTDW